MPRSSEHADICKQGGPKWPYILYSSCSLLGNKDISGGGKYLFFLDGDQLEKHKT